jgi:hypothetical protein
MKPWTLALIVAAIAVSPARAASDESQQVAALYARALQGDKTAVVDCIATLERILQAEPQNELARVYLGSSYTLRSRDLGIGPEKLRVLNKGIALMDAAVRAAPDNVHVRLVRALTDEALPFFTGRGKKARAEFLALAGLVERNPGQLEARDRQLLYLKAGETAQKAGDKATAAKYFRLGLTNTSDPNLTAQLQAALAKL